ncbi:MAG: SDR family oxidoreductase [Candidatus Hydrogenedentales bacterium]
MKLDGKAAVVTGASRGVGRATALDLARRGCAVLINYSRSKDEAVSVADEVRQFGVNSELFQGDVADNAACRAMMERAAKAFGRLDVLVNNAATTAFIPHSDMEQVTDEVWDRLMRVNVIGPFQCVRAARPHLEMHGSGEVVNVASVAGIVAMGSSIPYCASKAALLNMTVSLARTLGPKIRVNAVAPGAIQGEWLKQGLGARYDHFMKANEERAVLKAVCTPEDVSAAILAFIEGSDMVTGQTVVVDGGMLIGPRMS